MWKIDMLKSDFEGRSFLKSAFGYITIFSEYCTRFLQTTKKLYYPTLTNLYQKLTVSNRFLIIICSLFFVVNHIKAQDIFREIYISWEDFVSEYLTTLTTSETDDNSETAETTNDLFETLSELYESPLNINLASRSELLQLPFLSEQQADSILSYREHRKKFLTLGEFQFIPELDFKTRQYLSLFTYAGETLSISPTCKEILLDGKNELSYNTEIPFYKRAGFYSHKEDGSLKVPSQIYLGHPLRHTIRYRYKYGQRLNYGFTLEQDAGEPFKTHSIQPFDYASFYIHYTSATPRWELLLGDFKVNMGMGLLIGRNSFGGKASMLNSRTYFATRFSPHKGTDETNFMRGFAATYQWKNWQASAFLSLRNLDSRIEAGEVTSFLTSGQHRTTVEQERRNNLQAFTTGISITRSTAHHSVSLNAYNVSYDHRINPPLKNYNRYYLRGRNAAGASVFYAYNNRRWLIQTEIAADKQLNLATIGLAQYKISPDINFTLQARWLSDPYVTPYGKAQVASSRIQGEQGFMIGTSIRNWLKHDWSLYVDAYRFSNETYRASAGARGIETTLQASRYVSKNFTTLLRYQFRAHEQRVSGKQILQWLGKHRFTLQATWQEERLTLSGLLAATYYHTQTTAASSGWLTSLRGAYQLCPKLKLSTLVALFDTDNYATSVYTYEPQLKGTFSFSNFYYNGLRTALLAEWNPFKNFELGVKVGFTHYFDRNTIGQDAQAINGPNKCDIGVMGKIKF